MALDEVVSLDPNYDDAVLVLAATNINTGHGEMVIEPMTRLLKKRPDLRSRRIPLGHRLWLP